MPELAVASFNLHGGVDGWGRSYDVVGACAALDADVLVLQETWTPRSGADGLVDQVASELGYEASTYPMAPASLYPAAPAVGSGWGPRRRPRTSLRAGPDDLGAGDRSSGSRPAERGVVGLAVLSRLPVASSWTVELGRHLGDRARRGAVVLALASESATVTVAGTHMSHLRHGSPWQIRRLRRALARVDGPVVVAGDMNLWGPPLGMLMGGWRRAVVGRTWPAWRPLFQSDHILVSGDVRIVSASVVRVGGSDHLPVRASIDVPGF